MKKPNSDKIRVLRILNRFNVGGPVWNVALLTKYLPDTYETKLVGGKAGAHEGDAEEILSILQIKATIIPSISREVSFVQDIKACIELRKVIRNFQPNIVHTHTSKAGFLGRIAALTLGVPIIVHTYHGHVFEGYFSSAKSKIIQIIERFLARKSTAIIAISETQKKALVYQFKIAPSDKTHVIPLGFDLERFYPSDEKRKQARANYSLTEETIAVGIVGRLTAIKNHQLFLRAAKITLSKTNLTYRFFIVGDGENLEDLKNLSKEFGISSKVEFTSWIHSMEQFYPAMDLVCLTSINEGTPVTMIEAQASGVPVISTKVGGVENTMIHGLTGLLLSSFDPKELAEKIEHLASHPAQRNQMSKNAHTFVREEFCYLALIKNMDNLYKKLLTDE